LVDSKLFESVCNTFTPVLGVVVVYSLENHGLFS